MNEVAQVLNQTNHERKVAGYGVHHKKGGSAISKLGNKPMSWQEIQSKHGPIQTYTEGFTTYEEFKKMPPDLEAEYVNNLCTKYHIRHEEVSSILFELGENDLMSRLKIKGVEKKILKIKRTEVTEDAIINFKNDVDDWRKKSETAKIIDLSEAQRRRDIIENAEFISYDEFSVFTTDEKILYLNSLIDKYGVSLAAIERELFKLPATKLRRKLDVAGVLNLVKHGKNGFIAAKANIDFCDALKVWRGETDMEEKPNDIMTSPEPEKPSEPIMATPVEEPKKDELPESNISSFFIPVEEAPDIKAMPEQIMTQESISTEEANQHSTVFSANYRSTGMDCDELDALKLMFKNKLVEVCITVHTI